MKLIHGIYKIIYITDTAYRPSSVFIKILVNSIPFLGSEEKTKLLLELVKEVWKHEENALKDRIVYFVCCKSLVPMLFFLPTCGNGDDISCLLSASGMIVILKALQREIKTRVFLNTLRALRVVVSFYMCSLTIQKEALLRVCAFAGRKCIMSAFSEFE